MQEEILTSIHNIPIKRNFVLNLPYNASLKSRAKALLASTFTSNPATSLL